MKKRILIAYASYGSGHKSVAHSIKTYFEEQKGSNNYEIRLINFSDYSNFIGKASEKIHDLNFKARLTIFFNIAYKLSNHETRTQYYNDLVPKLFNIKKLKKDIIDFNPDLLVATHFFPSMIISNFKRKHYINPIMITVITDYISHEMWLKTRETEDAYIVPNLIVKNSLVKEGISKNKVYDFGIPISNKFNDINYDRDKILKKYHLKDNLLTFIFFGGGSSGSFMSFDLLRRIIRKVDLSKIQIVFISGHNDRLKSKCAKLCEDIPNIKVLGYTNDIASLLYISDAVITKAGGITVTECMAMKKPMLLIKGVGAQENDNMRYLCSKGYAIKTYRPATLSRTIDKIILNRKIITKMKNKLLKMDINDTNKKIYKLIIKLLK